MLFNSYVFLLLFLPIACAGHRLLTRGGRQEPALLWLNACSLFFYGWWNPAYLPLLLASILGNFHLGKCLSARSNTTGGRYWLAVGIALNLGLLAYFKYTGFALDSINTLFSATLHVPDIILPLAISFFTFNQIAYLVDAYEGMTEEYSLNHYTLFVSFFPHLLAGPIVHHRELIPQFFTRHSDSERQRQWAIGITVISFGLFKKVILADTLANYSEQVFNGIAHADTLGTLDAWAGALSFNLQVYFDFSGYCDIACGTALLFGITLPQNFLSPFKSANIIDFWKRWHITLSRFITSYVYTPLMRNTPGGVSFRKAMLVTIISMGISGLWHGAGWTFIAWGLLHGILLAINHSWRKLRIARTLAQREIFRIASTGITYLLVTLAMVLFRSSDINSALKMYSLLFSTENFTWTHHLHQPVINDICRQLGITLSPLQKLLPVLLFMQAWVWFLPSMQQVMGSPPYASSALRLPESRLQWRASNAWILAVIVALATSIMAFYQTAEFVYFQF